ncbi:MAG: MGMT family protein [Nanoarchaeota archaeon]|nr:MGMT family protein [Nanoarchaeota archaeon]MCG2717280.1 MGMT family protein [Nanoarchaeota archaeon]
MFKDRVYKLAKKIPKGNVTTYKEIAKSLNSKAYRAVGTAMNKNPFAPIVPCHRVINSDGKIGGFASGVNKKIRLLESEGVKVKDKKIDLKKYLFKFR